MNAASREFVNDLIDMAGYGIGYWAASAVIDDEAETYTVTEGDEFGDGKVAVLTHASILYAANTIVGGGCDVRRDIVNSIRERDADSDAADVVIQQAMFGEVIYG